MYNFKVGDRVILGITGEAGIITKCIPSRGEYAILLDGNSSKLIVCQEDIEPENIMDMEIPELESYSDDSNDEPFFERATVRWGFMSIKLAIYGKEGRYPHFHFYKNLKPEGGIPESIVKTTGGCIAIESANYFKHGNHTETLDRKEVEGLIKFLKERNKSVSSFNNWQYIIMQWNDNNPTQKQLPLDLNIPDYRSDMDTIQEKDKGNK